MSRTGLKAAPTGLPITSLLVALDGSLFAERAIVPACRLAARLDAPVHLWSAASSATEADERRARLQRLADICGASCAVVVTDRPREAIPHGDGSSQLTCLATHGQNRTAVLTHPMSAAVVAASDGPVLLVGPGVPPEGPAGTTLAVCVDGGPDSDVVIPVAIAWAAALGLDVTVLTVAEPVPESLRHPGSYPRMHGPHGDADAYVEALAEAWGGAVRVTGRAIYDPVDVGGALTDTFAADLPYLVVMGTRAPHGLHRLILGSTAAAVAHRSPAPVLVVPI